jgi:hypothetical protein
MWPLAHSTFVDKIQHVERCLKTNFSGTFQQQFLKPFPVRLSQFQLPARAFGLS